MYRRPNPSASEIRAALYRTRLRHHCASPRSLVVDELGLAHAKSRIDIAVLTGTIHGYEIKSARDTLTRLPHQLAIYRQTLHRLTLVTASRHSRAVLATAPDWCGITQVTQGPRGGLRLSEIRPPRANPDVSTFMLAHLLWRREAYNLLCQRGYPPLSERHSRHELYGMLSEVITDLELTHAIRQFMTQRRVWRGHLPPASCDD